MSKLVPGPAGSMCWIHHTVMSGEVHRYAMDWCPGHESALGAMDSLGPFEISASRNAVIVHRAELKTIENFEAFRLCLSEAEKDLVFLKRCDGRPND